MNMAPGIREPAGQDHEDTTLFCKRHPNVETLLRCNKCNEPICVACAVRTPVGYRCQDCIRAQQDRVYNMQARDPWLALGTGFGLSLVLWPLLSLLLGQVGIFLGLLIAFFAGGGAGGALAQIIRRVVQRRRGRHLGLFTLLGILLGGITGSLLTAVLLQQIPLNLPLLVFLAIAMATAWPQLR